MIYILSFLFDVFLYFFPLSDFSVSPPAGIISIEFFSSVSCLLLATALIGASIFFFVKAFIKWRGERGGSKRDPLLDRMERDVIDRKKLLGYSDLSWIFFASYIITSEILERGFDNKIVFPELNIWHLLSIAFITAAIILMIIHIRGNMQGIRNKFPSVNQPAEIVSNEQTSVRLGFKQD